MKRFLTIAGSIFLLLLGVGLAGGYFYGRSVLPKIPGLVQQSLKEQSIDFKFGTVEVPSSGLSLRLNSLSVTGKKLKFPVTAESARISIALAFSLKPVVIGLYLDRPKVVKAESVEPPPAKAEAKATIPSYLGAAAALVQLELGMNKADLAEFGAEGVTASVRATHFELGTEGLRGVTLKHEILVDKLKAAPWLSQLHSAGRITLSGNEITINNTVLDAGPFRLGLEGQTDLTTQRWNATLSLPKTEVSSASGAISARVSEWLTKIAGKVGIEAKAEGSGFSPKENLKIARATAKVQAKNLRLTVKHPNAEGDIAVDADVNLKMDQGNAFDFDLKTDLTQARVSYTDVFEKEKDIPLTLTAAGNGGENSIQIKDFGFKFHNLAAHGSGGFSGKENPTGNFNLNIAETALTGWEKFFPQNRQMKAKGMLAGTLAYQGPLKEWKQAAIDLDLKASQVTFPLVSTVTSGEGTLNSITRISLKNGIISQLQSDSSVDLSQGVISMGDNFRKEKGVPFLLTINLVPQGKRAKVERGEFRLAGIKANVSGAIENLRNPTANLAFRSDTFPLEELHRLSPLALKTVKGKVGGMIGALGSFKGPILDTKRPADWNVDLQLKNISLTYQGENAKKATEIKNLSGPIRITRNTASIDKLTLQTPNSSLLLQAEVRDFDRPTVTFALKGDRFQLADFYQSPNPKESVGFVAVPVAAMGTGKNGRAAESEDFRTNPWLKKTRVTGSATLKNADLGYAKADSVSAKITYDNLVFRVDPLVMKTFSGTVTTTTVWDGRKALPHSTMAMKADGVDANQFLGNWSEKFKDIVLGKLNTSFELSLDGMNAEEIKKSVRGGGNFSLQDGQLTTLKFTQKPLEALKKVPGLTQMNKTSLEEKLNQINGAFKVEDGKIAFSNLLLHGNLFDATASNLTVDFNLQTTGTVVWQPKEALVGNNILDLIRDGSGTPSVPLNLSGPINAPQVALDSSQIVGRIQQNAARKLTNDVKEKLQGELQKKLGEGLKGLFK